MESSGTSTGQLIGSIVGLILMAIPFQQIFHKAGFSRAWAALLVFGPLGWLICWLFLAIRAWPAKREA